MAVPVLVVMRKAGECSHVSELVQAVQGVGLLWTTHQRLSRFIAQQSATPRCACRLC